MSAKVLLNGRETGALAGADVREAGPGVYSVIVEGRQYEVHVTDAGITVAGETLQYEIEDPRQWKRSGGAGGGAGRASIVAPMPGKVVRILVALGDEVTAGQGIVVVEAMKMQNEMKSPRDGRVTAIGVRENDSVTAGTVLASIE